MTNPIKAALYAASPLGRLEWHERGLAAMRADNFDADQHNYAWQVDAARAEYDRGNFKDSRIHIRNADVALKDIHEDHDPDRLFGVKSRSDRRAGAIKTNGYYEPTREFARKFAKTLWKQNPKVRKAEMIELLKAEFDNKTIYHVPSDETLWGYLKECPKRGEKNLIPGDAQKAGRPKSSGASG